MILLWFFLTILLVIFGFRFIAKLFAPALKKYLFRKVEERFQSMGNDFGKQQKDAKEEGETSIYKMPQQAKPTNKKVGEYIDYEEID